jgi:ABC-type sugar transport system substrate-binding protein
VTFFPVTGLLRRLCHGRSWGVLLIAGFALVACGGNTGTGSTASEKTIAVFLSNGGDPYFQNKSYGYIKAQNDLKNVKVQLFDAGGYENSTRQIQQVENAIQRHVSAIVLTPVDSHALCGAIKEAQTAKIPVVVDDIMSACDSPVAVGISENSVHVGFAECKYMADKLGGTGGIVMEKGPAGAGIAIDRANGCHDALKAYPNIKVLGEQFGPSNIETGTKLTEDFVTAFGHQIKAIYTFGAVTGLGAANALKSAGFKPGEVRLATIDYHPEVLKYMDQGWIDGTIPAQPVRLAYLTTVFANLLADGKPVDGTVTLPDGKTATGKTGLDKCCTVRLYTEDEYVVDASNKAQYNASNAVAPANWKPPLQG